MMHGLTVYHLLVRSTRMLMRIGLQGQAVYRRDGLGLIPKTILTPISNPVIPVLLWNLLRIVTIRKPLFHI